MALQHGEGECDPSIRARQVVCVIVFSLVLLLRSDGNGRVVSSSEGSNWDCNWDGDRERCNVMDSRKENRREGLTERKKERERVYVYKGKESFMYVQECDAASPLYKDRVCQKHHVQTFNMQKGQIILFMRRVSGYRGV